MKKFMLLTLAALIVLCFCSCKNVHRKLEFDDGECYCFNGSCGIYDGYISLNGGTIFSDVTKEYVSINGRHFTITQCDCENINK